MESKGIVLMAFGKAAYGKMAFNMALSIRYHTPDILIHFIHDEEAIRGLNDYQRSFFNSTAAILPEDMWDDYGTKTQKMNPGKAKTRIYKYLPFDHNIYLDVDGAAMQNLHPLMDLCTASDSYYLTQVVGRHSIAQGRDFPDMQWAWADEIWEHFGLLDTDVLPAINSSFAYIRKGDDAAALFALLEDNFSRPMKTRMPWGSTQPDELYMNVTLVQMDTQCDVGIHPVYFNTGLERNWSYVMNTYFVLGIYGGVNFTHSSVTDMYDRLMHKYAATFGVSHSYKAHSLMPAKHANKRAPMA